MIVVLKYPRFVDAEPFVRWGMVMDKRILGLMAVMLATSCPAFAQDNVQIASAQAAPKTEAMLDLDNTFLKLFAATKKEWLDNTDPIIIVIGGKVILRHKGEREEVTFISPGFDLVKTVDHSLLGIFGVLNRRLDRELDAQTIADLETLKKKMVAAEPDISTYELPASTLDRQRMILRKGVAFIDGVLAKKKVTKSELKTFLSSMAPAVLANGDDAEALELHSLDDQVMKWKKQMTPEEWARLYVIVSDVHMARTDERYMQYFLFLLNEKEEGKRVIFCESGKDEQDCLKLLVSHITDEEASDYFFGDPMRMHRDFLADGASLFLKRHYKYFLVTPKSKAKR